MQDQVQELTESDRFDSSTIESKAEKIAEKASQIKEPYLGEDPDTKEALELEFFCLAK